MILTKAQKAKESSVSCLRLFLGFPLTEDFEKELKLLDRDVLNYYLNDDGINLSVVTHQGFSYFGKYGEVPLLLDDVKLLESNLYSILKKIVPNFPYQNVPLEILPII